jgi:hypothetical protein
MKDEINIHHLWQFGVLGFMKQSAMFAKRIDFIEMIVHQNN